MDTNLIKQSFAMMKPHAERIVKRTYAILETSDPELMLLFKDVEMERQYASLVRALAFVAYNIQNPERLEGYLEDLGTRHHTYGAKPKHFPSLQNAIVQSMEETLGHNFTEETKQAWNDVFEFIAQKMIGETGETTSTEDSGTNVSESPSVGSTDNEVSTKSAGESNDSSAETEIASKTDAETNPELEAQDLQQAEPKNISSADFSENAMIEVPPENEAPILKMAVPENPANPPAQATLEESKADNIANHPNGPASKKVDSNDSKTVDESSEDSADVSDDSNVIDLHSTIAEHKDAFILPEKIVNLIHSEAKKAFQSAVQQEWRKAIEKEADEFLNSRSSKKDAKGA